MHATHTYLAELGHSHTSIQSSVYVTIAVVKVNLFSKWDTVYCMFSLYVSVEIDLYSCEQI